MSFLSSIWYGAGSQTEGQSQREEDNAGLPNDEQTEVQQDDSQLYKGVDAAYDYTKKLGGYLYTFASKASHEVRLHADKLVEGTVLHEFSEERDKFEQQQKVSAVVPKSSQHGSDALPWVGFAEEDEIKRQVLTLSSDERNFLRDPPHGIHFNFDLNQSYPSAVALLEVDKNLQNMRYCLVPKKLKEEVFWRNYFYRVTLITQSAHLKSSIEKEDSTSAGRTSLSGAAAAAVGGAGRDPGGVVREERVMSNGSEEVQDGSNQEDFVSDAFDADKEQVEQMRKEIQSLEVSGEEREAKRKVDEEDGLDEIEKELEDLDEADYELVNQGEGNSSDNGVNNSDNTGWENEIEQLLEQEMQNS